MRVFSLFGRPTFLKRFHMDSAWLWLAFGVYGLIAYVTHHGPNVAKSIPVLFFISVYANFVGHVSSAQAAQVEVKQDRQIDEVSSPH